MHNAIRPDRLSAAERLDEIAGGHPDAADDVIDAAVDGAGRTAAQIRYVAELLGSLKGNRVRLDAADADAAALITDPDDTDFLAVQMPYRVPFESSQAA
jgi:DNA polymerase III sliding clamp (beta) subunit (PCNA family)